MVTAYVVSLRSPIEGNIDRMKLAPGAAVTHGETLAYIDNPLVDTRRVLDEESQADQMRASAAAAGIERRMLLRESSELKERAGAHSAALSERLVQQRNEAKDLLAEREAECAEARVEADREKQLLDLGVVARAEYDKLAAALTVAETKVNQEKGDLAAIDGEVHAARQGILTEPGANNDVAYSRQRADEVDLRLAENARLMTAMRSGAEYAAADAKGQSEFVRRLSASSLTSPIDGIVWKLNSVEGERVAPGDSVAQLVDCSQSFVLVNFPQDRMSDISLGSPARVRITGEDAERTAVVTSISGEAKDADEPKLAAQPFKNPDERMATVRIRFAVRPQDGCLVGRTAQVLIRAGGSNVLARWARNYF
jgi:multidrug resistance efflux pump